MSAKGTGNDVDYYLVDINDPKRLKPYTAECEDIIEALGMTFAEGNAFKALWRSCAARTLGKIKPMQDEDGIYDAEKIIYSGKRILAVRKRQLKSKTEDSGCAASGELVWKGEENVHP